MKTTVRMATLSLLAAGALIAGQARLARACGGFFCNPGGTLGPLPVAQTGENVLFFVNPNPPAGSTKIEAHIQIFYTGPADKFSWVLPIDAEPAAPDVGSDAVFTALGAVTRPQFQVNYHDEGVCKSPPGPVPLSGAGGGGSQPPSGVVNGPSSGGGVDVSFQGAVGPFEAAVIHSADSAALKDWLRTNGYVVSDDAGTIIDTYVSENKYFVALKLLSGKDVTEIRPIVLRFNADAPCIPLRLTAIAALSDLRVNLWVVGPQRTVPQTYQEILINQAKIDWLNGGANYDKLLKEAADEAGGNAFGVEYAGTAHVMDRQLWYDGLYNLAALRAASTPPEFLAQLGQQRFARDAKLLALLQKYIPEPQSLIDKGIDAPTFYNQLAGYWQMIPAEFAPFDPVAFTDELDQTVVKPLAAAQALFDTGPYLTRLATFISPEEMTKDPIFVFNGDLGDVPAVRQGDATYECGLMAYSHCDAPLRLRLPDGRTLRFLPDLTNQSGRCYGGPNGYQRGDLDGMPSLAVAWNRAEAGPGSVVIDNGKMITAGIDTHNAGTTSGCACAAQGKTAGGLGVLGLALGVAATLIRRRRRA
jgi:MYXO-CTERM domain-containing protein